MFLYQLRACDEKESELRQQLREAGDNFESKCARTAELMARIDQHDATIAEKTSRLATLDAELQPLKVRRSSTCMHLWVFLMKFQCVSVAGAS